MSNETQPQPSPAALLAGVLRVVAPKWEWKSFSPDRFAHGFTDSEKDYQRLDPTSKDDLSRVVAMLTEEQRERFDEVFQQYRADDEGVFRYYDPSASKTLMLTPAQILAALVAATGVGA